MADGSGSTDLLTDNVKASEDQKEQLTAATTADPSQLLLSKAEIYTTLSALDTGSTKRPNLSKKRQSLYDLYADVSAQLTHPPRSARDMQNDLEQKGLSLAQSAARYYNNNRANRKKQRLDGEEDDDGLATKKRERKTIKREDNQEPNMITSKDYLLALNSKWNVYAHQILGLDAQESQYGEDGVVCTIPKDSIELRGAKVRVKTTEMIVLGETANTWILVGLDDKKVAKKVVPKHSNTTFEVEVDDPARNRKVLVRFATENPDR